MNYITFNYILDRNEVSPMSEKIVVVALGHRALGTTLPEQKIATQAAAKAVADLVEDGAKVVISTATVRRSV